MGSDEENRVRRGGECGSGIGLVEEGYKKRG